MPKLPKGHVWLCELCGASYNPSLVDGLVTFGCRHSQEEKDRMLAERLWPFIKENIKHEREVMSEQIKHVLSLHCDESGNIHVAEARRLIDDEVSGLVL